MAKLESESIQEYAQRLGVDLHQTLSLTLLELVERINDLEYRLASMQVQQGRSPGER